MVEPDSRTAVVGTRFRWLVMAYFWLAMGIITGFQTYYAFLRSRTHIGLLPSMGVGLLYGALWLACMPLMLWLLKRFPLIRGRLSVSLPVHGVAGVVIGGLNHLCNQILMDRVPGVPQFDVTTEWLVRNTFLRIDVSAMTYWGAVALWEGTTWFFHYQDGLRRQAQLESELARAELDALRMQLNPHFLFNTLHTISSMIHVDAHAADLMVVRLSQFLRMTLQANDSQETSLAEELEFIERYLDIERIRFHDRLTVTYEVPKPALGCMVPRLILQPLVENAIRHGITRVAGPATITIRAEVEGGRLVLAVRDNGQGLGGGERSGYGVGLRNTRERLAKLYGPDSDVSVRNGAGCGVEATLVIPNRRAPEVVYASSHSG